MSFPIRKPTNDDKFYIFTDYPIMGHWTHVPCKTTHIEKNTDFPYVDQNGTNWKFRKVVNRAKYL